MMALLALALAAPADAERLPPPREIRLDADGRRLPDGALLRLGSVGRRHDGDVSRVAWSDDGTAVVTFGDDGKVIAWDAATGKQRWTAEGPTDVRVHALDVRRGRVVLLSNTPDRTLKHFGPIGPTTIWIWDAKTGRATKPVELDESSGHTFSNRDGEVLDAVGPGVAWNPSTGTMRRAWTDEHPPEQEYRPGFTRDGRFFSAGGERIWRTADGRAEPNPKMPKGWKRIGSTCFSPDGRLYASSCSEGDQEAGEASPGQIEMAVWERATGRVVSLHWFDWQLDELDWLPDGRRLIVYSPRYPNHRLIVDAAGGDPVWADAEPYASGDFHDWRAWSPDRKRWAKPAEDGTVLVWDLTRKRKPTDGEAMWKKLASDDAGTAWEAAWRWPTPRPSTF